MRKLLITGLAALTFLAASTSTQAGNPWPVIGGIAGGLILGEVLRGGHHHHGYYEEEPYYQSCWIEYRKVWDPYLHRYVTQKVRFCD